MTRPDREGTPYNKSTLLCPARPLALLFFTAAAVLHHPLLSYFGDLIRVNNMDSSPRFSGPEKLRA